MTEEIVRPLVEWYCWWTQKTALEGAEESVLHLGIGNYAAADQGGSGKTIF